MVPDYIGDGSGDQEEIQTAICDAAGLEFDGFDCEGDVSAAAEVSYPVARPSSPNAFVDAEGSSGEVKSSLRALTHRTKSDTHFRCRLHRVV